MNIKILMNYFLFCLFLCCRALKERLEMRNVALPNGKWLRQVVKSWMNCIIQWSIDQNFIRWVTCRSLRCSSRLLRILRRFVVLFIFKKLLKIFFFSSKLAWNGPSKLLWTWSRLALSWCENVSILIAF